jgi:hypothetical protein
MTKAAKGAFRGLRRFQIIEPIASPKALLRNGVRGCRFAMVLLLRDSIALPDGECSKADQGNDQNLDDDG